MHPQGHLTTMMKLLLLFLLLVLLRICGSWVYRTLDIQAAFEAVFHQENAFPLSQYHRQFGWGCSFEMSPNNYVAWWNHIKQRLYSGTTWHTEISLIKQRCTRRSHSSGMWGRNIFLGLQNGSLADEENACLKKSFRLAVCSKTMPTMNIRLYSQTDRSNTPFSRQLLKIGDDLITSDKDEHIDIKTIGHSISSIYICICAAADNAAFKMM